MQPQKSAAAATLPALREDLRLFPGVRDTAGATWLIYDPVRHRYFQIAGAAFELLDLWRAETAEALAGRAGALLARAVTVAEVNEVARFVIANNLAAEPPRGDGLALAAQEAHTRHALVWRLIHNYLFFKIPLVRPERFLVRTLPLVEPLYSRTAAIILVMVSLAGLYFASRQWDRFVTTFLDFLSLKGIAAYGATLVVVKALHELGHAYTATRLGVRVNTMGVAFMVLTPILYTDVTDAWRLQRRRDKLAIDAAGIVVEVALAGIALFLWAFLPDGPARSAAFATATTGLVMGLMVNLNPLMRFDGYHLIADGWGQPNLQSRSSAMAQWWLRERLFGLGHPSPETMPPRERQLLIAYALAMWVYRFFLFLGIALVVYFMFFKLLGIVLFAVEIVWFILRPIYGEAREWWNMRSEIARTGRSLATAAILGMMVFGFVMPWSGTVRLQAIATVTPETRVFAPRPAKVLAVKVADRMAVVAGQPLFELAAPDLDNDIGQAVRQIELAKLKLARIAGDGEDRSNRVVLEGELARHTTNLDGLRAERSRLVVRASQAGIARDVDRDLQPGEWIDEVSPVARIVGTGTVEAIGLVEEDNAWRIAAGAEANFTPEEPLMAGRQGKVLEVVQTGVRAIDLPYLSSVYGGAVASDRGPDNEITPRAGWHLVRVRLDGIPPGRAVRGTLHVTGTRESIAAAMWRRILQVLVREGSA